MKRTNKTTAAETLTLEKDLANERLEQHAYGEEVTTGLHDEEHGENGLHLLEDESPGVVEVLEEDSHAADDTLGLYLRQMGSIPLLSRKEELELAQRLETARRRFRHAALSSWRVLGHVVETFERIQAGQLAVDPNIDVVTSLGLSREQILARLPHNLPTLRHLLQESARDFQSFLRATTLSAQGRLRRSLWRRLRKASILAEELSPRIDLLERWSEE